jgi:putative transposase
MDFYTNFSYKSNGRSFFMPRMARLKDKQSIYHVMVRSIKEVNLFEDVDDKLKYLSIIKKYMEKYKFKVYAYCLMGNHGHLMIDANGADISKVLHSINFSYAQYFNRIHNRHGHLFQDRFKSKIVDKDSYLIALSAYIHNNPKDIPGYAQSVESYPYSSLREYVNDTDEHGILDKTFLQDLLNIGKGKTMDQYIAFVKGEEDPVFETEKDAEEKVDIEFHKRENEYRSHRTILARYHLPQEVMALVADHAGYMAADIRNKNSKRFTKMRSVACYLMNCFCNIDQKRLCNLMGNITQSRVSKLCAMGVEYAHRDKEYEGIIDKLIKGA